MFLSIILLIIGFVLLIKGADYLVDGSTSLAKKYGISNLVIGLTIVAFGTSAPELVVSLMSSLSGSSDLALGNVVGSNIANVLLILGVCAVIYPLTVQRNTVWKEIPFMLLASVVTIVMANDLFFDDGFGSQINVLGRIDGIILLSFFVVFMYYIFGIAKDGADEGGEIEIKKLGAWKMALYIAGGLVGLVVGGKLIVDGAITIATFFGISEAVIGLTIVAVGTSLPELATSLVAVLKKQPDIAVGNIVGSNIFNIFWILGLSSVIAPITLLPDSGLDMLFLFTASFLLFAFMFVGKKHSVDKWQGILFISIYIFYIAMFTIR